MRRVLNRISTPCARSRENISQYLAIGIRPLDAFWMSIVRRNPTSKFQKLRRTVLVRGHRRSEREEAEILQDIVQLEERRIAGFPETIALGEQVRSKGAQADQVVAAVHDHIDAKIVAG